MESATPKYSSSSAFREPTLLVYLACQQRSVNYSSSVFYNYSATAMYIVAALFISKRYCYLVAALPSKQRYW